MVKTVNREVNAAPTQTQTEDEGNNVWFNILANLCCNIYKNTYPEVDSVPTQNVSLNAVFTSMLNSSL